MAPEQYTHEQIAQWASVDPNILTHISTTHLSDQDRLHLAVLLQGATGVESGMVYEGNSGMTVTLPSFRWPGSMVTHIQRRVCLEGADKDGSVWRDFQIDTLAHAVTSAPDHAQDLQAECQAKGLGHIVQSALQKQNEPDFWNSHKEDTLGKCTGTPEELLQILEEQERAAKRYEEYQDRSKQHRAFDMWNMDELEASTDEEEQEIHVPVAHSVRFTLSQYEWNRPIPNYHIAWSPEFMLAAVRMVKAQPDVLTETLKIWHEDTDSYTNEPHDTTVHFVHNLLTNGERLTREDLADEVLDYIAEQVQTIPQQEQHALRYWPWLLTAPDPRSALNHYFASRADREKIESSIRSQKQKLKTLQGPSRTERKTTTDIVYFSRDARGVRALSTWLQKHDASSIYTAADFYTAMKEIEEIAMPEFTPGESLEGANYLIKRGPGSWASGHGRWVNATGIATTVLQLCQRQLPLTDAITLCYKFTGHLWPNDPLLAEIFETKLRTPADGWQAWDTIRALGVQQLTDVLIQWPSVFRTTFQSDLPAACTRIKNDVLQPLLDPFQLHTILQCTELLATLDREEAKTFLLQIADRPEFREDLQRSYDARAFPVLLRICYSNLCYPTPVQRPFLEMAEQSDTSLSSPMAILLHMEAKGGTPWTARAVPALNPEANERTWWQIVHDQQYPEPPPSTGGKGSKERESGNPEQQYADKRDQLLENQFEPMSTEAIDPDEPEMPQASHPNEQPRVLGTLSRELTGDNRYLLAKLCDRFNPRWLAHEPAERTARMDFRELVQLPTSGGEEVSLQVHMGHGGVVPMPMAAMVTNATSSSGRLRWAGHWSRRLDAQESTADVTITYQAGPDRIPNASTLAEVRAALPASLVAHLDQLSRSTDLPPLLQAKLSEIDARTEPLVTVVARVQQIVHQYYEYCFLNQHPEYAAKYTALLQSMPIRSERNAYLDFIHSLREEHEEIWGRGVCGQLATVLQAALRSLGVPAYFATGYYASGTTITTNDGHAWVTVPMFDADGRLFLKPVEATGGGIDTRTEAAKHVAANSAAEPKTAPVEVTTADTTPVQHVHEDVRQHFSSLLGIDLAHDDVATAGVVVRRVVEEMSGRPSQTSNMGLLLEGNMVTPRYANRLEQELDPAVNTLTAGTRALLQHILETDRATYRALNERFMQNEPPLEF